MKLCKKCGQEKDESNFRKNRSTKDGLEPWCNVCRRAYEVEYRRKNKELVAERTKNWRNKTKDARKQYNKNYVQLKREFLSSLKTPCAKCGDGRLYIIDFHHVNPHEKEINLAQNCSATNERLLREVKKCVCLCRNCHQEFHHFYGLLPKMPVEDLTEYLGRSPYEI